MGHALVVLNPVAGDSHDEMRRHLERHFAAAGWTCELYATTGEERVADVVRAALPRAPERRDDQVDLVVAAGGDGTVSGVAGGIAQTEIPMGVIPLGTGNTFARELGIPLALGPALDLLTSDHTLLDIDAMAVGERLFVLSVSIGISGLMMRDTERADKRRFGRVAYVWTGLRKLLGYQPHRFDVTIDDDRPRLIRASEIAIANSGALGDPSLRWSPQVELDDGRIDVCVLRARSILDYVGLAVAVVLRRHAEEPGIRHYIAERRVEVDARSELAVQGDGEFIGNPPIKVTVLPGALRVVVPLSQSPTI
jgi:YegS/Rv2252/BmrU family lipid kinase